MLSVDSVSTINILYSTDKKISWFVFIYKKKVIFFKYKEILILFYFISQY